LKEIGLAESLHEENLSFQALLGWFNQTNSKSSNVKQQDALLILSTIEKLFFKKAKLFSEETLNSSEAQS
jgi:hypothetical protein